MVLILSGEKKYTVILRYMRRAERFDKKGDKYFLFISRTIPIKSVIVRHGKLFFL